MGTITFEVHPITPTSPRIHACNHRYIQHFDFFCFLFFFAYFSFKQIRHGHIRERKEIPNDVKLLTLHFCYAEAIDVINIAFLLCRSIHMSFHDWRTTIVRWLFMHFSQDFLVFPVKKSDTSVKSKRSLNLTYYKHEP